MSPMNKEINDPTTSSIDVAWNYSKNGNTSIKLNAPKMLLFEGKEAYTEFPEGVLVYSYEHNGNKDASLRADYAIQIPKEQLMKARGNVVLKNAKGEVLETEFLIWDEEKEKIFTEELVKITQGTQTIIGEGFESDIYFSDYYIKNTRGIINLD